MTRGSRSVTSHGVSGSLTGQECGVECGGPEGDRHGAVSGSSVGVENDPKARTDRKGMYMCTIYVCETMYSCCVDKKLHIHVVN